MTEILSTDTPVVYRQKLARIAMDQMYQFVAVLDASGNLLDVNRAALEGAGVKLSDVEGKPFWECYWWGVSLEIQQALRQAIVRVSEGHFVRYDVEIYGRAQGKETIIIDFSMIPVSDHSGKVVFIIPEGRDITEKKAQERELARRNAELQTLLERVKELDELKTQFFANVSHELRTPLTLILGPARRLMERDSAMAPDERRESAGVIARNAQLLLKHVTDLLDLSKLEAGRLKLERQTIRPASLVRRTASNFDVLARERSIDFQVDALDGAAVSIDSEKLERVLMNLLSNAFKFVPDRGRIRCSLRAVSDGLVLEVEDSGPGVRLALRSVIFDRFRQGDGGADRQFGGTGLGLAIAREFVELHGGTLEVLDSTLGGALFRVSLPQAALHGLEAASFETKSEPGSEPRRPAASPGEASPSDGLMAAILEELRPSPVAWSAMAASSSASSASSGATVLVVEDNLEMNRFICQSLGGQYHVVSALNGKEGLEMALALRPAIIVSDIMMPVMSGVEMIAAIAGRPELAGISILVLSARADEELKVKLLEERAQDFITKPFSERDLLVRVGSLNRMRLAALEAVQARAEVVELRASVELTAQLTDRRRIESLMEELRLADTRKDEFLATLGHELRNPLAAISMALSMLERGGGDAVKATRYRETARRQMQILVRLVDDLLDVSRITRGIVQIHKEQVDLATVVHHAVAATRPVVEILGHSLSVTVAPGPYFLEGDATRLEQVLVNLLTNAARYTEPGGAVSVSLAIEQAEDGSQAVLRVRDSGRGIPEDMLAKVFDLFVQVNPALDRSTGGLGLGLTLVKRIVDLHAGTVSVHSDGAGKGSEFVVRLPLGVSGTVGSAAPFAAAPFARAAVIAPAIIAPAIIAPAIIAPAIIAPAIIAPASIAPASSAPRMAGAAASEPSTTIAPDVRKRSPARASRHVLLVEDSVDLRDILKSFLEAQGNRVSVAVDGPEGVAQLLELRPDVAFVDLGLPGFDGFEVARRVRAEPGGDRLYLVALTGILGIDAKARATRSGFDLYLAKPVDIIELAQVVRDAPRPDAAPPVAVE